SYATATGAVSANLATGAVSIGGVASVSIQTNSVTGSGFADTLTSGAGNDTLTGNGGGDIYAFGRGGGQDVIQNAPGNSAASGTLALGAGIATNQLWLVQSGNDL